MRLAKKFLIWGSILGALLWLNNRGLDFTPDYFQSDAELACQMCELDYEEFRDNGNYERTNCANLSTKEVPIETYFLWTALEDEKAQGIARLTQSMPKGPRYKMQSVEIDYTVSGENGKAVKVESVCEMLLEDDQYVKTREGLTAQFRYRD